MSIKLNWDDQTDQNLDAIEVYRSETPIDENNPGSPIANLPASATEYEDTNVRVGKTYYYVIAVVKGGNRSFTANQTQGYYSNLGPCGQVLKAGDWKRGYFGEITAAEWVTVLDVNNKIRDQLKSLTGITFRTDTANLWYKFVYKGKILFIPNVPMIGSTNWQTGYNAGFVYGSDDFGKNPDGDAGAVNQRVIIEIGGHQFIARAIRLSDKPTTQYLTDQLDFNDSEWKGTYSRLRLDAGALTDPTIQPRFSDLSSLYATGSAHMADASSMASVVAATPETLSKVAKTASINWMVVLELLP